MLVKEFPGNRQGHCCRIFFFFPGITWHSIVLLGVYYNNNPCMYLFKPCISSGNLRYFLVRGFDFTHELPDYVTNPGKILVLYLLFANCAICNFIAIVKGPAKIFQTQTEATKLATNLISHQE